MKSPRTQKGFSAAELLIAIFVGAAFILTSYQLYGIINKSAGDARRQAIASNISYRELREYAGKVGDTCGESPSSTMLPMPPDSKIDGIVVILFSCPYGSSSTLTKVESYVLYDNGEEKVEHAILASK